MLCFEEEKNVHFFITDKGNLPVFTLKYILTIRTHMRGYEPLHLPDNGIMGIY